MNKPSHLFASGNGAFDVPTSLAPTTLEAASRRCSQDIQRAVFSVVLGVAFSGCYVEPDHPRRHEVLIEERHEEPRRKPRHAEDEHPREYHEHHD